MVSPKLFEAIAHRKCLSATYNRVRMKLAPHILYTRNDAVYLDAVAIEKAGVTPREKKLASFKLEGLSGVAIEPDRFDPEPIFNPFDRKYAGTTLFMVDRA